MPVCSLPSALSSSKPVSSGAIKGTIQGAPCRESSWETPGNVGIPIPHGEFVPKAHSFSHRSWSSPARVVLRTLWVDKEHLLSWKHLVLRAALCKPQCYIFPALLRQPGRSRELNSRAWSKIREARFGFNTEGGLKR